MHVREDSLRCVITKSLGEQGSILRPCFHTVCQESPTGTSFPAQRVTSARYMYIAALLQKNTGYSCQRDNVLAQRTQTHETNHLTVLIQKHRASLLATN